MDQLLIVGGGLAGSLLALECHDRGIGFKWMVSPHLPAASFAAYGMCNPVHLRNQVPVWNAANLYDTAKEFFTKWASILDPQTYLPMPVNHLVTDEEELVKWRQNSESTFLWKYTSGEPQHTIHPLLNNEFTSEIRINEAFYLNIPAFIQAAQSRLAQHIINDEFSSNEVEIAANRIMYQHRNFEKMILADGVGAVKNSFFQYVPFNPCKGQSLRLKIHGLLIHEAIHKKIVLVPLADGTYLCGATYEWTDLSDQITEAGKEELLNQLNWILGGRYQVEVISQNAGVRPAISDRRPVVGWHPHHSAIGILNGFGTRGLLLGPSTCKNLLNNYVKGEEILNDWDVKRFNRRLTNQKMQPL